MILTCEQCRTSYRLDDSRLKPGGSTVRCSNCRHMWTAYPPGVSTAVAGADPGAGLGAQGKGPPTPEVAEELPRFRFELPGEEAPEAPDQGPGEPDAEEADSPEDDFLTDELNLDDLEMILESSDAEAGPGTEEDDLDLSGLEDDGDLADLGDGFKTEELDLADLEKMLSRPAPSTQTAGDGGRQAAEALDLAPAPEVETPTGDVPGDPEDTDLGLDFSDLDSLLEDGEDLEEPAGAPLEEPDPGLEVAPELKDLFDDLEDASPGPIEATAELDLASLGTESPAGMAPESPELLPELQLEDAQDLEDLFAATEDEDAGVEATGDIQPDFLEDALSEAGDAVGDDEEEITDIDLDLEGLADQPEGGQGSGDADGLLDLERLLGEDAAMGPAVEEPEELDLGDAAKPWGAPVGPDADRAPEPLELELDLEAAGRPSTDQVAAEDHRDPDKTRELDLADLESLLNLDTPGETGPTQEVSEEIDLDFDALTDEAPDLRRADDKTRELDLADLEKMLAVGDGAGAGAPAGGFEGDLEPPAPVADEGQMLDLSDLERMLSVEDTTDAPAAPAAVGDLEAGPAASGRAGEPLSEDLELEFDMPVDEPDESSILFDTSESEDMDLEFDLGDGPEDSGTAEGELEFEILEDADAPVDHRDDASRATTMTLDQVGRDATARSGDITKELVAEAAAAETAGVSRTAGRPGARSPFPTHRRRSSPLLVVLLIIALLGGGIYALVRFTGVQIPFVSEWLGAKAGGAVVPVDTSLKGYFVNNAKAGNLYVVEGQVRNDFRSPRSAIRVTGRIFANGKQFERSASAYCGNVMTMEELQRLDLADITQRMNNRNGANNANLRVAPGALVPFAVVFANLPPEVKLEEFAVEAAGSFPADQN